ncbi:glycoside hydrolase family 3 N-terminal domain-containing protein [Streptomyces ipomoeae]|uniref:glycoside hydrolase family 3 N-terminal domain-containing protein n=1 Tax=Streptomyces ipomoeae TaxID=103232 RepID=UPI0029B0F620|nr:glycoside hydrolase family 3 N-terminal domain-containing protein [Streptomyces ipomoeae]MDX2819820.1 glycoside hydrolase family 3 N-terminal domain-containing protein [Streptomyces ipomoeae]MDX2872244.1 glycoside hydrolase family 3 N-terminal domain-containing protein [Streptomyces ipomoeae]
MTTTIPDHDDALQRQDDRPWTDPALPTAERVEALLARLTLPEKVAQLSSAWEDVEPAGRDVAPGTSIFDRVGDLDETARQGLGQLTRPYGTVPRPALEHSRVLAERQRQIMAQSRLGIPAMAHDECLTGFTAYGATIYPTSLGMAATFDPELIRRVGAAIGADMAEAGVHQGLAPVVDVIRDYRWGRCEETYGEDPYLVGEIGEAYVTGLQSAGVYATLKHFAGYSASMGGRNHAPVHVGRRELFDVILPPFERLVAAGVGSVMNSYAEIDGEAPAASRWLLTDVLRDAWGFEGTVVSDYWSLPFLVSAHRVAADLPDAGALALRAWMDVELPDQRGFGDALVHAVQQGMVGEELVDRAVRRVLRQKIELGLLDPDWDPRPPALRAGELDLDKPANRQLAHAVAQSSAVLLSNDGALPLPATGRIALIGPCADDVRTMFGCYSFPNHVLADRDDLGNGVEAVSLRTALAEELPGVHWEFVQGCPVRDEDRSGIPAAVAACAATDLTVLVVGDKAGMFGIGTSGEGCDVEDLRLPGVQEELVEAVLATGKPLVLVVNSGRPYAVGRFASAAAAMVQVFLPGEEGGRAVAQLLSGRANFSGKLPVQIPDSPGGQPYTYLHPPLGDRQSFLSNLDPTPAFPFGHGLSYTTFSVDLLTADREQVPTGGEFTVTARVRNTGAVRGAETVQLYAVDPVAQVTRPVRSLLGFAKVALAPGERATVRFHVHTDRLAFTGLDGRRVVEPGEILLYAGSSSLDTPVRETIRLVGEERDATVVRHHAVPVTVERE